EFMKELEPIHKYDSNLKNFYQQIKDVFYQLQDLGYEVQNYHNNIEFNQEKLDSLNNRLDEIQNLQKKYGNTISEILKYKDKLIKKRDKLKSQEELISNLKKKLKENKEEFYIFAEKLSKIRKKYAEKLEVNIKKQFQDLAMEDTVLAVDFSRKDIHQDGIDKVQFLISTNPGEKLDSLNKIASGGEISRIMLALKTIIADIDKVDTLIFDEVDSGVGGKTAQKMAEKLAVISKKRQVICITHLPQIASMSDNHYFITKNADDKSVFTKIYQLDYESKKEELARMLGGVKTTDTTFEHASEMLELAREKKKNLSD
ncbi:MAG: DNA repair protein RecN, partial [bacterium]